MAFPFSQLWDICCAGWHSPCAPWALPILSGRGQGWLELLGTLPSCSPPTQAWLCPPLISFPASSQPLPLTCVIYCFHCLFFPCCFCTDLVPLQVLPPSVHLPFIPVSLHPLPAVPVLPPHEFRVPAAATPPWPWITARLPGTPRGRGASARPPSPCGEYGSCHTLPLLPNDV